MSNLICSECGDTYNQHIAEQCLFSPTQFRVTNCMICGRVLTSFNIRKWSSLPFITTCHCIHNTISPVATIDEITGHILTAIIASNYTSKELKERCQNWLTHA